MELVRSTSRGGFSVRSIFAFVLTVFVAAFLWILFTSPVTHAEDKPATWKGDTINYEGHPYFPAADAKAGESHGLPVGTKYYVYVEDADKTGNKQVTPKAHIIYFASGVDPPTEKTATKVDYDYTNKKFSNPSGKTAISITPRAESDTYESSCTVEGGIGWFICPTTVFLANAMDSIFELVSGFVAVEPTPVNDTHSDLYIAWNVMRSIANVAFIIAFLIIIYSQITSTGVSNYGIKKLLPRLIVAAILVNLSFVVCAIAVDLSNVIGFSLQDILIQIRENTFNINNDTWSSETTKWADLAGAILSGGAIVGGSVALATVTAGSMAAALYTLIPLLVGLLLTVLFVLLILAARQAIIIILIVIAPLAFVAYLLPNTEKWFEKWRELFMTMLIFFPAFSLVFGGSQLAGGIIVQNADSIIMMIFGMAVQIAPLVITPLLIRLSGGLLGRIAGIINDPRKGLLDRTKNWSKDRAEMHRMNSLSKTNSPFMRNPFRRIAQWSDDANNNVKKRTEIGSQRNSNRYMNTNRYSALHTDEYEAKKDHEIIENRHSQHIQSEINTPNSRLQVQNARFEAGKLALEKMVQVTAGDIEEYKNGKIPVGASPELEASIRRLAKSRQELAIEKMRTDNAQSEQQRSLAEALKASQDLRIRAGGIKRNGPENVLAAAISAVQKADADGIKNIQDAADIAPGDLRAMVANLKQAVAENNDLRARAFQNMLLVSGGAGIDSFRQAMADVGGDISKEVEEKMRGNILANHGGVKAKANDVIEWAVRGGTIAERFNDPGTWNGLSNEDIVAQHHSSLRYLAESGAISYERAQFILGNEDLSNKLNDKGRAYLESIPPRP